MPLRSLLVLCFSLLISFALRAQVELSQTVRGTVTDGQTSMILPGATITILNTSPLLGASSDMDGKFRFEDVPLGRYDILVSMIGYESRTLEGILLSTGKEVVLSVELTEAIEQVGEVVVEAEGRPQQAVNSLGVVSVRSFSTEQTSRFAASADDPAKMALSFAGIKAQDDISNVISVRGNAPNGLLWRIEGVEVPSPNHFSGEGYQGGAVTMLSTVVLARSDIFTGAFPAEYGNATAGVFDLRMRKGNNERTEGTFQIGVLGVEGGIEGPFSKRKKASYLVNYRYSTLGLANAVGFNTGNISTKYQDLNFKLNFPSKRTGNWSLFGVMGTSELTRDKDVQKNNPNRSKKKNKVSAYDLLFTGLKNVVRLNDKNMLSSILSASATRNTFTEIDRFYLSGEEQLRWKYKGNKWIIRPSLRLDTKLSSRSSLRSGVVYSLVHFTTEEGEPDSLGSLANAWGGEEVSSTLQGYMQWKYRISEKITFHAGGHLFYYALNDNYSIEPRAALDVSVHKYHQVKFAVGLHSKIESPAFYITSVATPIGRIAPNRELDLIRSFHSVVAHRWNLWDIVSLSTEVYSQYLYNVPSSNSTSYSSINFSDRFIPEILGNGGKGVNYGIEFTLERNMANNFYFLSTLSLFQSKYKNVNDGWQNTLYNSNYIFNVTSGHDFEVGKQKQHRISLNARLLWSGGFRDPEQNYGDRIDDYIRLDTRIGYRHNKEKYSWELSIDLQNTTNRMNENIWKDTDPLGILPVLKFKIEV